MNALDTIAHALGYVVPGVMEARLPGGELVRLRDTVDVEKAQEALALVRAALQAAREMLPAIWSMDGWAEAAERLRGALAAADKEQG